ncbi:MAG: RsmB/NOP family class I SAM-dependent RNA methyltransferase [Alphaproteobacteria bacterium]|nr:RsmB/NOP family class I SAM-dependent RNA methyltransferase [Alphaproteobacteria bacterium]MBP7759097.1 RsmB/NOP family class I SAM-dependent RNA methyltransferase [Alphaproteobacteria bacterium]MBP7762461.1 RsmB/NOP family class I SAM-dependent RNA methyltransferase [Alphaproteobacteria bacterium]MBP7904506.1 RsmB/NOP family class I SAM-dependent RNA methyltransferase [Alphaproteobacteria bacterium]
MKPSSRIEATIEILSKGHLARVPLDSSVGDYMRVRRYIGAKDRNEIAQRVYNIVRAHARLGWWLDKAGVENKPRHLVIAWLVLGEKLQQKRLADLFDASQYSPDLLSEQELYLVRKLEGQALDSPEMPEAVCAECPPEFEARLRELFGDDFLPEMQAMLLPAPLDLRVNLFLMDKEKVISALEGDNVKTSETPYSPWGLRCAGKAFLSRTKAFRKGWIEIQDEGSQMIAALCEAQPGMQVLDFCAGAGGKTLALAGAMMRKGRIVAMDTDENRLMKGRARYKKAQLADIIEVRPLSDDRHRRWLKRQKGTFDVVLLDVPCSGSGTWRRNPDMRWRVYGPEIAELKTLQMDILEKASPCVKPGGRLVYATCSLLREENEAQIEAFLERHPDFTLEPVDETRGLGSPFMRLTPLRHQTDGFFAAVMKRVEA